MGRGFDGLGGEFVHSLNVEDELRRRRWVGKAEVDRVVHDGVEIHLNGGAVGGVRAQCVDAHVAGVDGTRVCVVDLCGQAHAEATSVV